MTEEVRLLDTYQTKQFDIEYIDSNLFKLVKNYINSEVSDSTNLRLLDVGGGNGKYCDRFLNSFPNSHCTIVEPELDLLGKNVRFGRKDLIHGTYQELATDIKHSVIQFNWVLHHFVGESYRKSCTAQIEGLEKAMEILEPGGSILIFENFYEGYGISDLPAMLIYNLTASRMLKRYSAWLGANTAGVGVCFHSEHYWIKLLDQLGFVNIQSQHCYDFGNLSMTKKMLLSLKNQSVGFISARKPE